MLTKAKLYTNLCAHLRATRSQSINQSIGQSMNQLRSQCCAICHFKETNCRRKHCVWPVLPGTRHSWAHPVQTQPDRLVLD